MAEIKTIYKGESISLLFTFPVAYDMARLTSQKVFIGETEFAGVKDGQTVKLQLKSSDTDRMIGTHRVVLWLDDTTLGLRKPYCGDLVVAKTQAAGNTVSVSDISDIIIPIVISETAVTVGDILYNYVKGDKGNGIQSIALTSTVGKVKTYTITFTDLTTTTFTVTDGEGINGKSAYQVWLDLGNEGTEQDFINSLASGGIDLSAYLTELEAQGLYQPIGAYLTAETDPTVPEWAKAATKPTYTAAEVGAAETDHSHDDLHTHSNKSVLDATTASFTLADESKLDGLSNYTHPATHSISEVSGLQTALDGKVDDSQVLTNVPSGALFTDTVYTHPATHSISEVSGLQTALDGKVDDSQVLTNVPAGAVFTDTIYTHPESHPATIITQDATHRFVTDAEKTTWSGKAEGTHNHDDRYYTEGEIDTIKNDLLNLIYAGL